MLALRFRCRCRCSHMLPCYQTQLLSLKQVPSRRSTHPSSRSSATTSSSASLPASEQKVNRRQGVRIALCNESMLLASVVDIGMPDTKMRPRGDRFYRPPAAAPLSLKPDGHFQPPRWLKLVGPGGHRLGLDVPSTGTACGVIVGATGTHGDLW